MSRRKKEQSQTQKIKEAVTLTGALFHKELHIEMVSNKEALIDGLFALRLRQDQPVRNASMS